MTLDLSTEQIMVMPPKLRLRVFRFLVRWSKWDEALPIARLLAEEQSDGLLYRSALAQILSALGKCDQAAEIVADLEMEHPGRPYTLAAAGDLEMARGNLPEALKRYLEMVKLRDETPDAWRRLAVLYLAAGQADKAHAYCRKIIEHYDARKADGGFTDVQPHPEAIRALVAIHRLAGDESIAEGLEQELAERESREEGVLLAAIENTASQPAPAHRDDAPPIEDPFIVEDTPKPAPPLPPEARECLTRVFGYTDFRSSQEDVIARALAGQDQLVVMPTGAGKSLCYYLSKMHNYAAFALRRSTRYLWLWLSRRI